MKFHTTEELMSRYIKAYGSELAPVYEDLQSQCFWLHLKWKQYCSLYGTNRERIGLLNSAAASFFAMLQDILWEDTLLHLAL